MSNVSKRRREGTRSKIKSMGDHKEFLKRITKTLYYGKLPTLPCLSMPVTEISSELWSMAQRGRSLRRLHTDEAASIARAACVSPCALVLAILYLERLKTCNPDYLHNTEPSDLFLVSLMVSNKFLQDDGEDDEVACSEWAASADTDLKHLKRLELNFLSAIDWKIFVSSEAFEVGLRRLERAVALRQARLQGFFTYTDLLAAGAGRAHLAAAAAAAAACLALALAYLASLAALLAAAPLASRAASHLAAAAAHAHRAHLTPAPAHLPPHHHHHHYGNATADLPDLPDLTEPEQPPPAERSCCAQWQQRLDARPRRSWLDSAPPGDWAHEPWWSTTALLNWLYQSSLVNPMQRWLDRLGRLAAPPAERPGAAWWPAEPCAAQAGGGGRCVRSWLNLSKLSALMVTVSDR